MTKNREDKVGQADRKRISASDIADNMLKLIHRQEYQPGDRLREQEIADRFGVSRGPVREALRILETRNAIRIEPMRGATVVRMSDEETIVAVEISGVLFGLAARRACSRASAADKLALQRGVDVLKQLTSANTPPKSFFRATVEVGTLVTDCSRSPALRKQINDVRIGAPNIFGPLGFLTEDIRKVAVEKWQKLVDAIIRSDEATAERLANEVHLDACQNALAVGL